MSAWSQDKSSRGWGDSWGPPWVGPVRRRARVDVQWLLIVTAMFVSGLGFFGWRGGLAVAVTAISTTVSYWLCRIVARALRPQGPHDSTFHALVLGMLLGLSLPLVVQPFVPLLAGILLGIIANGIGRAHRVRVHPVAVVILLLWIILLPWDAAPHRGFDTVPSVLKPHRAFVGDVSDYPRQPTDRPWWDAPRDSHQAVCRPSGFLLLLQNQRAILHDPVALADMLSTSALPRMGELLLGAVPGPVGATSPALLIVLGMYLMYRRQARWSMAAWALAAALGALLVMPTKGPEGWSIVLPRLVDLGPVVATTYLAMLVLSSPMPLILLILAPMTAPMSASGKFLYALILGSTMTVALWVLSAPPAALVGLVLAGLVSRPLDALHRSPFVR